MIKKILLLFVLAVLVLESNGQRKKLFNGKKISRSVKIKSGTYFVDPGANDSLPAIFIEGNDLTIDFNNALLQGSPAVSRPDQFQGLGLWIKGGKNIRIKNLRARGFKIALRATGVENLVLENCDFSYNYRPYLNSTQEKEDISDWMSYHQNENNEWLRYGAAMYLQDCDGLVITGCRVTGGQNALMMKGCDRGLIYNNDFSFNSGIGIGLYRCSGNTVAYNKIDFNVRGYSHGVYNRGQDSAGILVYEQSQKNTFYNNSVTHSGDGFFLWAGQSTMDNGQGGCNDNNLVGNDFSYAPTNGIEVTFSRNRIHRNRIFGCDHGIWGGYSYGTHISSNKFRENRIDIAIENGQDNKITYNVFGDSKEVIRLWSRKEQPADWGYAKLRDTRSRDYFIGYNNFSRGEILYNIKGTMGVKIQGNVYGDYYRFWNIDQSLTGLDTLFDEEIDREYSMDSTEYDLDLPNAQNPFAGMGLLAGRQTIRMTPWGPYDYQYPLLWLENPVDSTGQLRFSVLGPKGAWKIKSATGVSDINAMEGEIPGVLSARLKPGLGAQNIRIEMEYSGPDFTDIFGKPGGAGHLFKFEKYFMPIPFTVNWFSYDPSFHDPLKSESLFPPNARVRPVKTETTNKLEYAWWGGLKVGDQTYKQFITVAEGQAEFEAGTYELGVTWDDAVRVYVDGKMVLDEWNPSLYKFDESPHKKIEIKLEAGNHFLRVEHVEKGGFATLNIKILRK